MSAAAAVLSPAPIADGHGLLACDRDDRAAKKVGAKKVEVEEFADDEWA